MVPPESLTRHPPWGDAASGLAKPAPRLLTDGLLRGRQSFAGVLLPLPRAAEGWGEGKGVTKNTAGSADLDSPTRESLSKNDFRVQPTRA